MRRGFLFTFVSKYFKNQTNLLTMSKTIKAATPEISAAGAALLNEAGINKAEPKEGGNPGSTDAVGTGTAPGNIEGGKPGEGEPFINSAADKDPILRNQLEGENAGPAKGANSSEGNTGDAGNALQGPNVLELKTGDQLLEDGRNEREDFREATQEGVLERMAQTIQDEPLYIVEALAKIAGDELLRRNPPAPIMQRTLQQINELAENELHEERVKRFGEGYVYAKNGDRETIFTAAAWKGLPGNKDGWREVVKTPPEVLALNK